MMTRGGLVALVLVLALARPGEAAAAPGNAGEPTEPTAAGPAGAPAASPAEQKRAQARFNRGEKLFSLGRFDAALRAYRRAFELVPYPEFLFNIGQCYRNLGDYERANHSFRRYLRLRPNAANQRAVKDMINQLEKRIAEQQARDRDLIVNKRKRPIRATPVYRRWQFWTGVAAVSIIGGGTFYLSTRGDGLPTADGQLSFGK